jgi:amino acid adenylation domain-containing protein
MTEDPRPVTEQISEISARYPDRVALSANERQLSYRELDLHADRLAGYLAAFGVGPGGSVAICMERSFDWVVAALAIMRAGAAYIPLDSAWPDARLCFAIDNSGASVLLGRAALLDRLMVKARGIDPRRDAAAIAAALAVKPTPISPKSLAYVIYTSGSTGNPKGVEITHSNLAHLVQWHRDAFGVTEQDRASHLAGLGFDAAVWELWPHLSDGATVCLADDAVRSSAELMQQWMIRERVTIGFVPTVHAKAMMAMEWPGKTALRFLLTGGEALHHTPPAGLPFKVVNNYGPTECTVVATSSVLESGSPVAPAIGRPINGATVYLLNEEGDPVPDGGVGEIYIGGNGVGRGYRNLPDLNQRSFLPDPFAPAPDARMYRTGDRGMRRPDGEIEFRGRLDRQTKIRGQRIELDEIDHVLARHPSIEFATVTTHSSGRGENRLVGYVLPRKEVCVPSTHEIQMHLLRTLPEYMIPDVFVQLEALPLSASGKLDLSLLPRPTAANLLEGASPKAPYSPTAEKLLQIIRELLEKDNITVEDNFFLAGGHSLLGMQLLMRLRKSFGVDVTLRQLFEAPSAELLAIPIEDMLRQSRLKAIWQDVLRQEQVNLDDDFFSLGGNPALTATLRRRIAAELGREIPTVELMRNCTIRKQAELMQVQPKGTPALPPGVVALRKSGTGHKIFWVHYLNADLANLIGDDQSFFSVGLTAEDFVSLGRAPTLQSIAACFIDKILATQAEGPYTIGGLCVGGILAYEIASQLQAAGREVSLLVLLDPPNPSYLDSCDSLARKLHYVQYALRRAERLGPRITFTYVREHLFKYVARSLNLKSTRTERSIAQQMIEAAAFEYRPRRYDGKVLLLLASERAPHVNFLPGWEAVIPGNLHTQYVDGHHRELTRAPHARRVADAIIRQLSLAGEQSQLNGPGSFSGSLEILEVEQTEDAELKEKLRRVRDQRTA